MQIVGAGRPSVDQVRERAARLIARLRAAAEGNGHDPTRLRIVAVTKAWPLEVARTALDAGLTLLGESRVQEAEPKVTALPEAEWHFIGRLQSNKARRAIRAFDVIHSVDSMDLMHRLDGLASEEATETRLLIQVNVSGEIGKAGVSPQALAALPNHLPATARLMGLMTIAPMGASAPEARVIFRELRELRDRLEVGAGIALPELSMGMTADAEAAAAEGATLVRIGTALFGPRG